MFLEFISNPAVKFRNITSEIQKLPSKKPETILKKLKENKKLAASMGIELGNREIED